MVGEWGNAGAPKAKKLKPNTKSQKFKWFKEPARRFTSNRAIDRARIPKGE